MTDQALRNYAFRVLDLVVESGDDTAKAYLRRLSRPQLDALGEVVEELCDLLVEVMEERCQSEDG